MTTTEALINGQRSAGDIRDLLRKALTARIQAGTGLSYVYVHVVDHTETSVVYCGAGDDMWQCDYSIAADGTVSLGFPTKVVPAFVPAPSEAVEDVTGDPIEAVAESTATVQATDRISGRVLEAKGKDDKGGRIFRVQIIEYGDSKNKRRYPESVMRAHASLYEGARAYDHHRTEEELKTSTITGMVGSYRNVEATATGLEADLHLLPSAVHAAETLDHSLAAQQAGLPATAGVSHDVYASYKPIREGGLQLQEATAILKVNSADLVAEPAAGGRAVRMVAGGIESTTDPDGVKPDGPSIKESDVTTSTADVLAALKTATPEQLAAVGLSKAAPATEAVAPTAPEATTPAGEPKSSFMAKMMIKAKVEEASLPTAAVESVTAALPERITEADVDAHIASVKAMMAPLERAGLVPTVGNVQVTQESHDKKVKALDAFFAGDHSNGYRSFREAYLDFTGYRPSALQLGEDLNRKILRECFGGAFDSSARSTESLTTASWAEVLGDSVTRRMIALYSQPELQEWRLVCSDIIPVNDFREQKRTRIGGFGLLPEVAQGAPYQPLTSPGDEQAVYSVIKRGGTEDLTIETIANDDIGAVRNLPRLLGLAAAITLYRFVFDIFPTNAAVTYDATALFHANHANTDNPAVLGQSTLSVGRRKMRKQAAFGDATNILSLKPKYLIVPSDLEEIAFQLATSAVAIPATPAGPTDTPNIHQGIRPIVVDYYTDANDWYLGADPQMCPTIEVGFYQGRELPELFTQADNSSGTMFNADKMTWKIRHIYSGTPLEHRGFYRGAN